MLNTWVFILLVVSITFAALGNIAIILMILYRKTLRNPGNYLLLSLALSDCLVALFAMPPALLAYVWEDKWFGGNFFCSVWIFFDVLSCSSSILNLTMICVDRYQCIVYPLHYLPNRTTKFVLKYIYVAWLISFGLAVFPSIFGRNYDADKLSCRIGMGEKYQIFAVVLSFYLPLFCMMIMYFHIYRIAKQILKEDNAIPSCISTPSVSFLNSGINKSQGENQNTSPKIIKTNTVRIKPRIRWQDWKATITLGMIMLAFIICWLPFFTLTLWESISESMAPKPVGKVFLWLGYYNSLLNPIIYCLLNREFRMNTCVSCKK
ncbi:HTR7 [Lepeophtheirus salmonis]|uniref:HTR7 n=1 Tax=Lepeophtheirus salmonis TaxID=72036 RepID=A0A7R8D6P5_LEPSM|nr:5-hydroxytryptamine receptor-like [Lepeophtheirus salmonis]CAB4070437.1 HTR7 [Lepeophtheirus salmonis]CAF3045786.1 HTR7 [Lepeophtheirus salmonis]